VLTSLELLLAPLGHLLTALGPMDLRLLRELDLLLDLAHIPVARVDLADGPHQILGLLVAAQATTSRHSLFHVPDAIAELLICRPRQCRGNVSPFAILWWVGSVFVVVFLGFGGFGHLII